MKTDRRRFLGHAAGGLAVAAWPGISRARSAGLSVGIVGGGIIGATIAYHLARTGARVTVFEKAEPASGATSGSFALINTISDDPHYRELRKQSVFAWRVLNLQLPLQVSWGGLVSFGNRSETTDAAFAAQLARTQDPDYPVRLVDAGELRALAPNLSPGAFDSAVFTSMDGHVDAAHATRVYLEHAETLGARTIHPCQVTDLEFSGNRLRAAITTQGRFELDRIVIAGGIDTPELAAKAGFRPSLLHRPGILARSTPTRPVTNRAFVRTHPMLLAKQLPNGAFVAHDGDHPPANIPEHGPILSGPIALPPDIASRHGERILRQVADILPAAADTRLDRLTLAYRPMPEDGKPIVGWVPNSTSVYVAVMHSGVTLSAIMGQYVTAEVLGGPAVDMLAPYRPDRFHG